MSLIELIVDFIIINKLDKILFFLFNYILGNFEKFIKNIFWWIT
jgi:hypothetical protein